MKCINEMCHKEIGDMLYCPYCGTKQERHKVYCGFCGAEMDHDAVYCNNCGKESFFAQKENDKQQEGPLFIDPDGTCSYCSVDSSSEISINIPIQIDNIKVIKIGLFVAASFREINLPNSVLVIGGSAFSGCSFLEKITIPNSVTTIEGNAFSGCAALSKITLPQHLEAIEAYTFYACSALEQILIPPQVQYIGEAAFSTCTSLKRLSFPASLRSIGRNAFSHCSSLKRIVIPSSVEQIEWGAFCCCDTLVEVVIEGPTIVDSCSFTSCPNLKNVLVKDRNALIDRIAFDYNVEINYI